VLKEIPGKPWGNWALEGYDLAQICRQGHIVSMFAESHPEETQDHCIKCGAETVTACLDCKEPIRGYHHVPGIGSLNPKVAPSYCHKCGKPYPWMKDRLQTARELLDHDDKLSLEDRKKLWSLLQYVMSDPKSDLTPAKKKLFEFGIAKALPATREFFLDFLAKLGAEVIKS
jgi:hypothetical protein